MSIFQRKKKEVTSPELDQLETKLVDQLADAVKKHDRLVVALATRLEQQEQRKGQTQ